MNMCHTLGWFGRCATDWVAPYVTDLASVPRFGCKARYFAYMPHILSLCHRNHSNATYFALSIRFGCYAKDFAIMQLSSLVLETLLVITIKNNSEITNEDLGIVLAAGGMTQGFGSLLGNVRFNTYGRIWGFIWLFPLFRRSNYSLNKLDLLKSAKKFLSELYEVRTKDISSTLDEKYFMINYIFSIEMSKIRQNRSRCNLYSTQLHLYIHFWKLLNLNF